MSVLVERTDFTAFSPPNECTSFTPYRILSNLSYKEGIIHVYSMGDKSSKFFYLDSISGEFFNKEELCEFSTIEMDNLTSPLWIQPQMILHFNDDTYLQFLPVQGTDLIWEDLKMNCCNLNGYDLKLESLLYAEDEDDVYGVMVEFPGSVVLESYADASDGGMFLVPYSKLCQNTEIYGIHGKKGELG
jgi:hypothetical protein